MTDDYPEHLDQKFLRLFEQAKQDLFVRVGGVHDVTRETLYPDQPPGLTLHLTWLEPDDDPQAMPKIVALNLHLPASLVPLLLLKLKQAQGGRQMPPSSKPPARKRPKRTRKP